MEQDVGRPASDRIASEVHAVLNLVAYELEASPGDFVFPLAVPGEFGSLGDNRRMIPVDVLAACQILLQPVHLLLALGTPVLCPSPTPRGILVWRDMAVNVTVSGPADRVRAIQLFNLGNGARRSTGILPVFFGHGAGCPCYVDWKTDLPCRPGSDCCVRVIESWTIAVVSGQSVGSVGREDAEHETRAECGGIRSGGEGIQQPRRRGDGDRVAGSLNGGLSLLQECLFSRLYEDVERSAARILCSCPSRK